MGYLYKDEKKVLERRSAQTSRGKNSMRKASINELKSICFPALSICCSLKSCYCCSLCHADWRRNSIFLPLDAFRSLEDRRRKLLQFHFWRRTHLLCSLQWSHTLSWMLHRRKWRRLIEINMTVDGTRIMDRNAEERDDDNTYTRLCLWQWR